MREAARRARGECTFSDRKTGPAYLFFFLSACRKRFELLNFHFTPIPDQSSRDDLAFDVVKSDGAWKIIHNGKIIGSYSASARAFSRARERALAAAAKSGAVATVRVAGRSGKITVEWTSPKRPQSLRRRPDPISIAINDQFEC